MMFKKINCGPDFLRGFEDGRLKFDFLDYTPQYDAFHDTQTQFYYKYSNKAKTSLTIQYRWVFQNIVNQKFFGSFRNYL